MGITPVQVAYRGFQCGLSNARILNHIHRALNEGRVNRPPFTRWPGGDPISVQFGESHLTNWRRQYEDGMSVDLPAELTEELNDILGVPRT